MKITNKTGLPEPIVNAIRNDDYTRGGADISVTDLISPIRQVALKGHHGGEMEEDAADRIFALMGKIGHGLLQASGYDVFTEERMHMKVGAWTLSGAMDSLYLEDITGKPGIKYPDHTWGIDDYKFTSAYVVKPRKAGERSRLDDWFLQLNLYRLLAKKNGFEIGRLRLVLLLRDWSVLAAKRDPDFPQKQVKVIEVPLMELGPLESWVFAQIEKHMEAQQGLDQYDQSHLPECTAEERWARPETWAVMKKGRKSALRVLDSHAEAMDWIEDHKHGKGATAKGDIIIAHRPGENIRCANYCSVVNWCLQAKELGVNGGSDKLP